MFKNINAVDVSYMCFMVVAGICMLFLTQHHISKATPSMITEAEAAAICDKAVEYCVYDAVYYLSCQQALTNCKLARELK